MNAVHATIEEPFSLRYLENMTTVDEKAFKN